MIQGLRTAIYRAADLERAREWHAGVPGFRPYFDEPFYVGFMWAVSSPVCNRWRLTIRPVAAAALTGGVEDADEALGRLLEVGATVHGERPGRRRRHPGRYRLGPRR